MDSRHEKSFASVKKVVKEEKSNKMIKTPFFLLRIPIGTGMRVITKRNKVMNKDENFGFFGQNFGEISCFRGRGNERGG